mmetsp:Transcript_14632/g.43293  ORF Transcript_14632/g.43293 Transcript_14632/m.43293 type:complete len:278 (+) Transcript_14632:292-1125(+)
MKQQVQMASISLISVSRPTPSSEKFCWRLFGSARPSCSCCCASSAARGSPSSSNSSASSSSLLASSLAAPSCPPRSRPNTAAKGSTTARAASPPACWRVALSRWQRNWYISRCLSASIRRRSAVSARSSAWRLAATSRWSRIRRRSTSVSSGVNHSREVKLRISGTKCLGSMANGLLGRWSTSRSVRTESRNCFGYSTCVSWCHTGMGRRRDKAGDVEGTSGAKQTPVMRCTVTLSGSSLRRWILSSSSSKGPTRIPPTASSPARSACLFAGQPAPT